MQVQVNTDNHIKGGEGLSQRVTDTIVATLGRFQDQISRVEVHLGDENGRKAGQGDKRCAIEARLNGHQPFAATHHADTLDEAIDGAAERLETVIDHALGRLADHKGRTSMAGEQDY